MTSGEDILINGDDDRNEQKDGDDDDDECYNEHDPNDEDKDDGFLNEGSFSNAGPPPASHGRPDFRGSLHSDLLYIRKVIFHRMMMEGF